MQKTWKLRIGIVTVVAMIAGTVGFVGGGFAAAAAGDVSGTVFDDVNENGSNDGEPGIAGVTVMAYSSDDTVAGSATTAANGTYVIAGLTNGTAYRIEFTNVPADYVDGPIGPDSSSSVTFAVPEASTVDFGVHIPETCPAPPANALINTYQTAATCSVAADITLPQDTFGLLDVSGAVPAAGQTDVTASTPMFHLASWSVTNIGNVLGTAIDTTRGDIYAAASSNYAQSFYNNQGGIPATPGQVRYGDLGGGADSLAAAGTVYQMDAVSGAPSVFAQLPQQSTVITHSECEGNVVESVDRTTGVGLGNVVYDRVNDQLFAANWEDGHIYRLSMGGTILDAYDAGASDDGLAGLANGAVPFGLEISTAGDRLFFGTLFTREIWSVDLNAGSFTGTPAIDGAGTTIYENSVSETLNSTLALTPGETAPGFLNTNLNHHVSDLEILPDGSMLAGIRVGCEGTPHSSYNHSGQTHKLQPNAAGIYTNDTGALNISATGDAGLDDNYGGVAYLEQPDGSIDYVVSSADILTEAGPHGLAVFNETNAGGGHVSPLGAIDFGTPFDPKGIIGDVEVYNPYDCTPSTIQIGNRVWLDLDGDGVQDAGEASLAGVDVTLFAADGVTVLATTTTDADGVYTFGDADGVGPNTSYVLGFDASTTSTPIPGGFSASDLIETAVDTGGASNADLTDSDIAGGTIAVTTGGPGENDHGFDAGFTLPYDLALTQVYASDTFGNTTDGVIENGEDVTFTITVTNQGFGDAIAIEIIDYLPAGFSLNDAAWTDNGDGTATYNGGPLASGASVDIPITLTADSASSGALTNWAEISVDDGNDVDSTPDTTQANDNQPAAVGDPTDDVNDNTAGDEDDHDPAGVTVIAYDLALTKAYTSDTFGNTTDGVIENGEDVTFTITVTNQGTVSSGAFAVTDYLPAGFSLNDAAWADNGDGTATIMGGPLAAGASADLAITLTADSSGAGDIVNWAEISSDSGNDPDSTPDTTQANDDQPTAPGQPGDDVIDNTGGDEDDHDPAGVIVDAYDLALTKAYTSDTFGNTTDGVIENGEDVTFTITVTNQGTVDATNIEVTDYLPSGFDLNDAAWNDNGDGTADRVIAGLVAGASTDLTITMTANGVSDGTFTNWAEISADDGNDADSTPDATQANDNQPAAAGDPTDDVVDNSVDAAGDPDEDDHDPASVAVGSFDLALTKAYTSDTFGNTTDGVIENGTDVVFTISVINQGTLDAASFTVTDYLPAGFVLNDAAWTDNGDGTASFAGGALAAGASASIAITVTAVSAPDGSQENWAEISTDDGNDIDSTPDADQANDDQPTAPGQPGDDVVDNAGGDEDDHDVAGVSVSSFDLALTKTFTSDTFGNTTDGLIENGTDATFTITVTNQGDLTASSFDVTDYLPAGFDLNDAAWTDNGDGTATISGGPLAAGASVDLTITITANGAADGDFVNWAEISSDDGNDIDSTPDTTQANDNQPAAPGDPTDGVIDNSVDGAGDPDEDDHDVAGLSVVSYDLALTKAYTSDTFGNTTDGVIERGEDVTFTITVSNQGGVAATNVEVTDYMPPGFTLNDAAWADNGDGTASIAIPSLAAGATTTRVITLTAESSGAGEITNWAEISSDDGNDVDSTPDATQANDNQPAAAGDPTDDVTDNSVDAAGDPDEDDHDPASVTVDAYDLALTKTFTSDTFASTTDGVIEDGENATFTITVTNQGTVNANTFSVTDYLPAGFDLNDAAWADNGDGTATITGGPLAAGASVDLTITITANGAADGDVVNWAEISSDDGNDIDSTPDTTQANDNQPAAPGDPTDGAIDNSVDGAGDPDEDDHDVAGLSVVEYDLALTKVYRSDTFGSTVDGVIQNASSVEFTITVTNQGTLDATLFTITDYVPTGFVLNDAAWTDNGDSTASITVGPLAAGASIDLPIVLTAISATPGESVNWAEISTDDGNDVDSTPDANQANDDQPTAPGQPGDDVIDNAGGDEDDHDLAGVLVNNYDLALTKEYTSDTFGLSTDGVVENGANVTFTITVTNQGTVDATNFSVVDYLPAGFVLNDAAWTDNGDGTATFAGGALAPGASTNIAITLTADSAADGEAVNWAEIASDAGFDADSTPDTIQANDNQPAAVGDPTDNVTNNAAGDEDDHDPASVVVASFDLALTKEYTSDTFGIATDGVLENGSDVTFTITVSNQGTVDASAFTVIDYLPAGFDLNDAAWSDNGDGTASITGGSLAAGASTNITITLTAVSAGPGPIVNWAEIATDSGNDVDSTPDTTQANDNQPAAVGDPTDGVVDNSGGDEDDHDLAGATIVAYDLALTKVYTSDSSGNTTDASVQVGGDVTFTISVINQGTIDATSVTVLDSIPRGFALNDAVWTDNGNSTASRVVGPIAAGASLDVTITLAVISADVGQQINIAEIAADSGSDVDSTPDADPSNDRQPALPGDPTDDETNNAGGDEDDHDIAGVTVDRYDLALITTYTSDTFGNTTDAVIEPNTDVVFTIEVTNQGTLDAGSHDITAYVPAGFVLNDAAWTDNGDGTATIAGGALAAGDSTSLQITIRSGAVTPGSYVLWAEISADDGDDADSVPDTTQANDNQPSSPGDPTDNVVGNELDAAGNADEDDHDPAGVGVENFDLALIKALTNDGFGDPLDGVTEVGSELTFTITVINQGTIDATTFDVIDDLPPALLLNDASWSDNGDGTATFTGGPLAAGDSVDITLTATLLGVADGDYVNVAEISATNGNDIDSTPNTDLTDDNQPAAPGDPTDNATDNSLDGAGDPDEDDHDLAGFTVASYDLALTKVYTLDTSSDGNSTDGRVEPGDDAVFTITVTNQGTLDASAFTITDYLPAGFDLNDATWTDNGDGTATFGGGPLAAGASADTTITLTATTLTPGSMVNVAEVSADDGNDVDSIPDTIQANDNQPAAVGDPTDDVIDNTAGDEDDHDIAGLIVDIYDLEIEKSYLSDSSVDGNSTDGLIQIGDDATFEIEVFNVGTLDATIVEITDYLPAGFVLNDAAWTNNGDETATRAVGPIAAGGSVTVTITATSVTSGAGDLVNVVEITLDDGDDIDSVPNDDPDDDVPNEDDIDEAPLTVDAYDLALRKVYTSDSSLDGNSTDGVIEVGDDITFTVTVFNQGTADAANVDVTDFIPAGFVLNDAAWTDNGDGTAVRTISALAAGDSTDLAITLTAAAANIGDQLNAAEISRDDGSDVDSTPNTDVSDDGVITDDEIDNNNGDEDDHDPAPFRVAARFDLALSKTLDVETSLPVITGQDVTFLVAVTNEGSTLANDIVVSDYVDLSMWDAFDVALNPAGVTSGDQGFVYSWSAVGTSGEVSFVGTLAPGETVVVPVTLTVAAGTTAAQLVNTAEISEATPRNPDGSVPPLVVDEDSTPDDTDTDPVDEDDHDVAVVAPPTFSLGNQVWLDVNNNGVIDGAELGIAGVPVHVFGDADGDGSADDLDGDGSITAADALGTTTTDSSGLYLFSDLEAGEYVVGIPPAAWDVDAVLYGLLSSDPTVDDTNTDVDSDDNGFACGCSDGYVFSGSTLLGDIEPTAETPDNDVGKADISSNLTVDFGFWEPRFDLALRKERVGTAPVEVGDSATFVITVFNQGDIAASNIGLIDYLPDGLTLNDSDWVDSDAGAITDVAGPLAPGESVSVEITVTVGREAERSTNNLAEITEALPTAVNGLTLVMPNGLPLPDVDSTADASNIESPVDNEIDNAGNDEDDHDIAELIVLAQVAPPLAVTGRTVGFLVFVGLLALIAGAILVLGSRRKAEGQAA